MKLIVLAAVYFLSTEPGLRYSRDLLFLELLRLKAAIQSSPRIKIRYF